MEKLKEPLQIIFLSKMNKFNWKIMVKFTKVQGAFLIMLNPKSLNQLIINQWLEEAMPWDYKFKTNLMDKIYL